jgi:hypothetical protein
MPQVIHQRRLVQTVWDSGTLHQIVGDGDPAKPAEPRAPLTSSSKTTKSPLHPSSKKSDKQKPAKSVKSVTHTNTNGKLPPSLPSKPSFSMDRELDMELSDGDIIYVGSDTEGEMESRYSVGVPNQKPPRETIYISDQDSSVDYDSQEDLPITRGPPSGKQSNGIVKIDRKREYWSSKSGLAVGTP